MTRFLGAVFSVAAACLCLSGPAVSQPVQYIQICDTFGGGYYYIPGTDTCLKDATGETRVATVWGLYLGRTALREEIDRAVEAIAMASALPTARIEDGHNYAIAGDWGYFGGANALGLSLAIRLKDGLQVSSDAAYGLEEGQILGRVAMNYSFGVLQPYRDIPISHAVRAGAPVSSFEAKWRLAAEATLLSGNAITQPNFWSDDGVFDGTLRWPDIDDAVSFLFSVERDVNENLAWRISGRHRSIDQSGQWKANDPDPATGDVQLGLSSIDFDVRRALDDGGRFRAVAGVRGFDFDEEMLFHLGSFNQRSVYKITGLGPRLGVDARVPVGGSFAVVADAAVSLLYANFDDSFGNKPSATRDYWFDDYIYAVDARAGVSVSVGQGVEVVAGYRVEHWSDLRQSFDTQNGTILSKDLTLHGPFLSAAVSF